MIHHERLRPPHRDYPADEWNIIEKGFHPEFLAQLETILALGNGYLGMRGCPEEGGPNAENSTLINGFYETHPIVYGEEAYGFAKTGQTICNVTDAKTIKLFVDDEPFWLPDANLLTYDRRLNMKSGTLDREILWETPTGKQVLITSRRLVSFANRHVAAISYRVTLVNADAHMVISSEMAVNQPSSRTDQSDPRQMRMADGPVLQHRLSYANDRRIVLCHSTQQSRLTLTCATDQALETSCKHAYKTVHTEDFGQVAFTIEAQLALQCTSSNTRLSYFPDCLAPGTLRPCRVDNGSHHDPGVPGAAHRPRALYGRFLASQRCPCQGYQGGTHETHHRRDPTSDSLQSLSNSAGLRPRGRRRCAGQRAHWASL